MRSERLQDGVVFVPRDGGELWEEKVPRLKIKKAFPFRECLVCGRLVSIAGWAWRRHEEMHERRNEV